MRFEGMRASDCEEEEEEEDQKSLLGFGLERESERE